MPHRRKNQELVDSYIAGLPEMQRKRHTVVRTLLRDAFQEHFDESLLFSIPTYFIYEERMLSFHTSGDSVSIYLYDRTVLRDFTAHFTEHQSGRNCIRIFSDEELQEKVVWIIDELKHRHSPRRLTG